MFRFKDSFHISIMKDRSQFEKMENFSQITIDKNTIKIFLTIAKNRKRMMEEICNDTGLEMEDIVMPLKKLEDGNFIVKNPGPLSKKYRLGFNGQMFAEQLKSEYPEVKELLGEESLLEPLKNQ